MRPISVATGRAESVASSDGPPTRSTHATTNTTGTSVTNLTMRKPSLLTSVAPIPAAKTNATPEASMVAFPHGTRCRSRMYWIISAGMIGSAAASECNTFSHGAAGRSSIMWRRMYSATSKVPAGTAGTIYPGSFDCEKEKNIKGARSQMTRNTSNWSSAGACGCDLAPRHHERVVLNTAATTMTVQGSNPSKVTGT